VTSFEVKVAVTDSQKLLSQGMNVTIDFKAGELNQVLVVPTAAIVQQAKAQGVFAAKTGGISQGAGSASTLTWEDAQASVKQVPAATAVCAIG
jgi:hypothetical protein